MNCYIGIRYNVVANFVGSRAFGRLARTILILSACVWSQYAIAQGNQPVPEINSVELDSDAVVNVSNGVATYTYEYSLANDQTNTGELWFFKIDVSSNNARTFSVNGTYPVRGGAAQAPWAQEVQLLRPFIGERGERILSITQEAPSGWNGGASKDGTALFATATGTPRLAPGDSLGGFRIVSERPPTIRTAVVLPRWFVEVEFLTDSTLDIDDISEQGFQTETALRVETKVLGPTDVRLDESSIAIGLRRDLAEALTLGWITDQTLYQAIVGDLDQAISSLQASEGDEARAAFAAIITTITNANSQGFNAQFADLVTLNAQAALDRTPTTPIPFVPEFSYETDEDVLPIGETFQIRARYVNVANNDEPIAGFSFFVACQPEFSCPNTDFFFLFGVTDENGEATIDVFGENVGVDRLEIRSNDEASELLGNPRVEWTGGVDLVIPFFIPPLLESNPGETVFISDTTLNQGSLVSDQTITRYFISEDDPFDFATAQVIGERVVPGLDSGSLSNSAEQPFQIPLDFEPGRYTLAACADDDNAIVETNETNNCSFSELDTFATIVQAVRFPEADVTISIADASMLEGDSGQQILQFPVTLTTAISDASATVSYVTEDGSASSVDNDYVAQTGTLQFNSVTESETQLIDVPIIGDTTVEDDETFSLIITVDDPNIDVLASSATGSIVNDDGAQVLLCSDAIATPNRLWPPKRYLQDIVISGVTSPSGEVASIFVTSIEQDEVVDTGNPASTFPDGFGVGTSTPQVRAERFGQGDGRVYIISFEANTSDGGQCMGSVQVTVPRKESGEGSVAVDSGIRFDSTVQ